MAARPALVSPPLSAQRPPALPLPPPSPSGVRARARAHDTSPPVSRCGDAARGATRGCLAAPDDVRPAPPAPSATPPGAPRFRRENVACMAAMSRDGASRTAPCRTICCTPTPPRPCPPQPCAGRPLPAQQPVPCSVPCLSRLRFVKTACCLLRCWPQRSLLASFSSSAASRRLAPLPSSARRSSRCPRGAAGPPATPPAPRRQAKPRRRRTEALRVRACAAPDGRDGLMR